MLKYQATDGIIDSFSLPHVLGYSTIAVIQMNMACFYPDIFWNTANLIVDSGALEDVEDNKSTQYGKVATAIARMQSSGVHIALPLINEANFGFTPDVANDQIICGFKNLNGIGDDVSHEVIAHRPYKSFDDFCERMIKTKIIKPSQMIMLIKAGCFTEFEPDRKKTMYQYFENYVLEPCKNLTLSQLAKIQKLGLLPEDLKEVTRYRGYQQYVTKSLPFTEFIDPNNKRIPKRGYHDRHIALDQPAQEYFVQNFSEDSVVGTTPDGMYIIGEKKFNKEIDAKLQPLKDWMSEESNLERYNKALLQQLIDEKASGSLPKWDMDSLSFYYTEHELAHIDTKKYMVSNFFDQPETPPVYEHYYRKIKGVRKKFYKYNIVRLAGTVLDKNKDKHVITLLTTDGVVNCKFTKGQFAYYNKTISRVNPDGSKTTIENSWFARGNKVLVAGYRLDDQFRAKTYSDSIFNHTLSLIEEVKDNGDLIIATERAVV